MKKLLFLSLVLTISYGSSFSQELLKSKENAHASEILTVSINGDATFLVTGGMDKRAQIWDVKSGDKIKVFAHSNPVTASAFSATGKYFCTGSFDGKIILFDASEWKIKKMLKEHSLDITSISFNPINDYFVTGSKDNTAKNMGRCFGYLFIYFKATYKSGKCSCL